MMVDYGDVRTRRRIVEESHAQIGLNNETKDKVAALMRLLTEKKAKLAADNATLRNVLFSATYGIELDEELVQAVEQIIGKVSRKYEKLPKASTKNGNGKNGKLVTNLQ